MKRTRKRALVINAVRPGIAILYAAILGMLGFSVLLIYTNNLTALVGLVGIVAYVGLYSFFKRRTPYGTLVGSISGAVPPVAGYTAASNQLDLGAVLLFFILVFWQMPHFYAIAIRRQKEYAAANIPTMPIERGLVRTKIEMLCYLIAYTAAIIGLAVFGYAGIVYLLVMIPTSLVWVYLSIDGFYTKDNVAWARKMFLFSLIATLAFALMASLGRLLP